MQDDIDDQPTELAAAAEEPKRRGRGRPPKHPAIGPMSDADRQRTYRWRQASKAERLHVATMEEASDKDILTLLGRTLGEFRAAAALTVDHRMATWAVDQVLGELGRRYGLEITAKAIS